MPHISRQATGRHSSPLPSTLVEMLCRRRFSDQLVARRLHPVPPWVPPHPACQAPQVSRFYAFEELAKCSSITQLSVNFIKTSASAMGRSLRGHFCGNCCPGSGFFGPQSSGAIVAAVQIFFLDDRRNESDEKFTVQNDRSHFLRVELQRKNKRVERHNTTLNEDLTCMSLVVQN